MLDSISKVCVVGAGTMGCSIAQVFAKAGFDVLLCDKDVETAEKGLGNMQRSLEKLQQRGKMTEEAVQNILTRIYVGVYEDAADCLFMVEAIYENMKAKKKVFAIMEEIMPAEAILVTNTSTMSISEITVDLQWPWRAAGMHFFNPATMMKLVEVIKGQETSQKTADLVCAMAEKIGKTPVRVEESPGFAVNRILVPMINEAACVLAEGVASAEDIDTGLRLGANHPMGPLALGDLIGLDVVLAIMEVLLHETGDNKYRPAPLLRKMVRAGQLGRKTGEGFFKYE